MRVILKRRQSAFLGQGEKEWSIRRGTALPGTSPGYRNISTKGGGYEKGEKGGGSRAHVVVLNVQDEREGKTGEQVNDGWDMRSHWSETQLQKGKGGEGEKISVPNIKEKKGSKLSVSDKGRATGILKEKRKQVIALKIGQLRMVEKRDLQKKKGKNLHTEQLSAPQIKTKWGD